MNFTYNTYIKVFINYSYMSEIPSSFTREQLALHTAGELLPQSAAILKEDIESGRIVLKTVESAVGILDEKPE